MKHRVRINISISIQILVFMLLISFLPVAAMMMLTTYEKQQLVSLENSIVQQARITAASLSIIQDEKSIKDQSIQLLQNMNKAFDCRIRILDSKGKLLADSSTISNNNLSKSDSDILTYSIIENSRANSEIETDSTSSNNETNNDSISNPKETTLYRFFSIPIRIYRAFFSPPITQSLESADFYSGKTVYDGVEIEAALNGKYGATTRFSTGGQVSITLYSAVPIYNNDIVSGVVLTSRSTYRILQNLYELRLDLAKIFAWSIIAVIAVTLFLSFQISLPLKKLALQASHCADKKGHIISTVLHGSKRNDEIGELSRSFSKLLENLDNRIKFIEAFSSDVSHEFKNPLAAIRSSAELASDTSLPEQNRQQFCTAILDEVEHLQILLSGVRNISKIDGETDNSNLELIYVNSFIQNIISREQKTFPSASFSYNSNNEDIYLEIDTDHFDRLITNLLENAASFSNTIQVTSFTETNSKSKTSKTIVFKIEDNGRGIPESERQKVFNRFYSNRTDNNQNHTGLGLSIVKAIVDSKNGTISIHDSKKLGGAMFTIKIPTTIEKQK